MARKTQASKPKLTLEQLHAQQQEQNQKLETLAGAVQSLTEFLANSQNRTQPVTEQQEHAAAQEHARAPGYVHRYLEASDQEMGGVSGAAEFRETNGEQRLIQTVEGEISNPLLKEKLDNLAFNENVLTIHIHETSEKDAQKVFEVSVGGETVFFRRGETKKVKRKFVEVLARARPVTYENEEYLDGNGEKQVRYPTTMGLRYPFNIVDPTPLDTAWLKSIMAQP